MVADPVVLRGLFAVVLAGLAFSSMSYTLTVSQTLMFAIEVAHSLMAGALLGALVEELTGLVPMQVTIFLYSMGVSVVVAELVRRKVSRDTVLALVASLSAVVSVASLWGLVYTTPLGVSRALGALWGAVLLVTAADLVYMLAVAVVVILVAELFDLELKYISFDPDLAFVSGLNVRAYYYLVYAVASLALSVMVKVYGSVLVSVLTVVPSIASQYLLGRASLPVFLLLGLSVAVSGYAASLVLNVQTSLCIGLISLGVLASGAAMRWIYGR